MLQLKELARKAGMAPEDFLQASVEQLLMQPRENFSEAAAYELNTPMAWRASREGTVAGT